MTAAPADAPLTYPFEHPPEEGATIEVADGIFWASLPVPFVGLRQVNIWLLRDGPGWTMIDTGHGDPTTRMRLEHLFATVLHGRPVTRLILTHFHPDHAGNSGFVAERWGGLLPLMSQAEWFAANLAVRDAYTDSIEDREVFHQLHGLDPERAGRFRRDVLLYSAGVRLPPAFERLTEGDRVSIDGVQWQAIRGGGHSPEHMSLWCADRRILIAGDQILPTITTNVSVWQTEPLGDPLAQFLDACHRFEKIISPDALILPSHRRPFHGVRARLHALLTHHQARLDLVADGCAEPRAAGELLNLMFDRPLDGHQVGFAMGEALAHLNHLVGLGVLDRLPVEAGVQRFVRRL